jgi:hypothetical protein
MFLYVPLGSDAFGVKGVASAGSRDKTAGGGMSAWKTGFGLPSRAGAQGRRVAREGAFRSIFLLQILDRVLLRLIHFIHPATAINRKRNGSSVLGIVFRSLPFSVDSRSYSSRFNFWILRDVNRVIPVGNADLARRTSGRNSNKLPFSAHYSGRWAPFNQSILGAQLTKPRTFN